MRSRGRSVRRRAFVSDGTRLILPAFGVLTGGLNVLDRAFAGLFGEFARSLRGEPNRTVTLQDGRRSLELVTAIYQSARQGKTVELPVSRSDPDYGGWTSGASGPG